MYAGGTGTGWNSPELRDLTIGLFENSADTVKHTVWSEPFKIFKYSSGSMMTLEHSEIRGRSVTADGPSVWSDLNEFNFLKFSPLKTPGHIRITSTNDLINYWKIVTKYASQFMHGHLWPYSLIQLVRIRLINQFINTNWFCIKGRSKKLNYQNAFFK